MCVCVCVFVCENTSKDLQTSMNYEAYRSKSSLIQQSKRHLSFFLSLSLSVCLFVCVCVHFVCTLCVLCVCVKTF